MPRTITIDGVDVLRLQLLKTSNGEVQVYAEYTLKAGNQVFQTVHKDVTVQVSGARRAAVAALFDAIAQDVSTNELA